MLVGFSKARVPQHSEILQKFLGNNSYKHVAKSSHSRKTHHRRENYKEII